MTAEEEESGIERSPSPSVSAAGCCTSNSATGSETVKADDNVYVGDAVDSAHQDMLQLNLERGRHVRVIAFIQSSHRQG